MDKQSFLTWADKAAKWGVEYRSNVDSLPVRPDMAPGDIFRQLPVSPPITGEPMEAIFADFENIIMPGMTHWQHPRFFAYFPSNAAPVAVIADYLISAMSAQCMLWQTSPAATELETRVIDWLRQALDLPDEFSGVIQDSASSATLAAVLTMRERALDWKGNKEGLTGQKRLRVYASDQVHTSIDRAIWFTGIGEDNLVRIPTQGASRAMNTEKLEAAIRTDRKKGYLPAGIIACVGGTSVGATDEISKVCGIARQFDLYTHVDAAWAGSAMICPEFRHFWEGVGQADSIVFNPHKWLGTPFDCSAHFIRDPATLTRTLAIQPEYLKTHGTAETGEDGGYPITNYSEWSIPLGRRFRALKLWFLIRYHGLEGLREMIRNHVKWSENLAKKIRAEPGFELVTDPMLSLFSFRYVGDGSHDLDEFNLRLINAINSDGRTYLTQTRVDGKFVIRVQIGQFETTKEDVEIAWQAIKECAVAME